MVILAGKAERHLWQGKCPFSKPQTVCNAMLTSYVAFVFVYKSDFVLIIYILNKPVLTSCHKLSSNEAVNMALVFKIVSLCGSCRLRPAEHP